MYAQKYGPPDVGMAERISAMLAPTQRSVRSQTMSLFMDPYGLPGDTY